MRVAIFSDLHLKHGPSQKRSDFVDLLRVLAKDNDELWLLGDILDLFVGSFSFWRQEFGDIFSALETWIRSGKKVTWIEGNHDFHIGPLLQSIGVEHFSESCEKSFVRSGDNKLIKIYLAHGDLVDQSDFAYLKWRAFIRHPLFKKSIEKCPEMLAGKILWPLARQLSQQSRKYDNPTDIPNIKEAFRTYSKTKFSEGFDAVFLGHSHVFDQMIDQSAIFLNLGSWFEKPRYAIWDTEAETNSQLIVYDEIVYDITGKTSERDIGI